MTQHDLDFHPTSHLLPYGELRVWFRSLKYLKCKTEISNKSDIKYYVVYKRKTEFTKQTSTTYRCGLTMEDYHGTHHY